MSKSKIEWTESTWNPVTGCSKVSEGCRNCYAEVMSRRLMAMGQQKYRNGFGLTLHSEALSEPESVTKPTMFFVCSMGDLFHAGVPFWFIDSVMSRIERCRQHTFQILTKRPENMYDFFRLNRPVPENAWIGTTVECADTKCRIDTLHRIGEFNNRRWKVTRFLSCEPLLSDLGELNLEGIDMVIVGGESGTKARPMKKEWVLNIKRQCEEQGVAFFFKQWGTYGEDGVKRNKKANGCLLDGVEYKQMPKGGEK